MLMRIDGSGFLTERFFHELWFVQLKHDPSKRNGAPEKYSFEVTADKESPRPAIPGCRYGATDPGVANAVSSVRFMLPAEPGTIRMDSALHLTAEKQDAFDVPIQWDDETMAGPYCPFVLDDKCAPYGRRGAPPCGRSMPCSFQELPGWLVKRIIPFGCRG